MRCWGARKESLVPPDLGPAVALAAGIYHTCALTAAGAVRCWPPDTDAATPPPGMSRVAALVAGDFFTCALTAAGAVRCWGRDRDGQCSPPADLGPAVGLATGRYHACALLATRRVRCWGNETYSARARDVPSDLGPAAALAAGSEETCALLAAPAGAVRCWGRTAGVWEGPFAAVAATGVDELYTLDTSGGLAHWGPAIAGVPSAVPPGLAPAAAIACVDRLVCASMQRSGKVRCWYISDYDRSRRLPVQRTADGGHPHACAHTPASGGGG